MIYRFLLALALISTTSLPLAAGDRFETPVIGEILPGWQRDDGSRMAAIRLRLTPGWKTYWRKPGDAGIPPVFDWSGSQNLHTLQMVWPTPKVFLTAGMRTIGYSGDLILPIILTPHRQGKSITLNADLDIGVCSDICVPHQMTLQTTIDDTSRTPVPSIAAALASTPFSAKEAGVTSATCALSSSPDGFKIEARLDLPSTGGREVVIIEPGQSDVWISETKTKRNGQTLVAVGELMADSSAGLALNRSDIRFTVLGKKRSVDIKGCTPG